MWMSAERSSGVEDGWAACWLYGGMEDGSGTEEPVTEFMEVWDMRRKETLPVMALHLVMGMLLPLN